MRVVFDLQGAQTESGFRGIGRFSVEYVKALIEMYPDNHYYILLAPEPRGRVGDLKREFAVFQSNVRFISWPSLTGSVFLDEGPISHKLKCLLRDYLLALLGGDLLHVCSPLEPSHTIFAASGLPVISLKSATFYDAIPLAKPESYLSDPQIKNLYDQHLETLSKFEIVLPISKNSLAEAKNLAKISEQKLKVIYPGLSPSFSRVLQRQVGPNNLSSEKHQPFVLAVGGVDERKNIRRLIRAFADLPVEILSTHELWLVGKVSATDQLIINEMAKQNNLSTSKLKFLGFVSDEELVALYGNCKVFVFPSLHEGFGLPPLEALAVGAPVVASSSSSIPEVLGDRGVYIDPENWQDMRDKLTKVLLDPSFRDSILDPLGSRASLFSWEKSAEDTWKIWNEALAGKETTENSNQWLMFNNRRKETYRLLLQGIRSIKNLESLTDLHLSLVSAAIEQIEKTTTNLILSEEINNQSNWNVSGAFTGTYSLSALNRGYAASLKELGKSVTASISEHYSKNECVDFESLLARNPEMARGLNTVEQPFINSLNDFPPVLSDTTMGMNILHSFGWEESLIPENFVSHFNSYFQAIGAMSNHVKRVLQDSGVIVPITVTGIGETFDLAKASTTRSLQDKNSKFVFLHISSCFPRKGVDKLLEAFAASFSNGENVELRIKSFPNPHNDVEAQILDIKQKHPNCPDIFIELDDFSQAQILELFDEASCLVMPSRGEGFGLPAAEAMVMGVPVVTTGWSGQLDFCTSENSWLVDFKFALSDSHVKSPGSVWADPDVEDLGNKMREVFLASDSMKQKKTDLASQQIKEIWNWSKVVSNTANMVASFTDNPAVDYLMELGVVTTWNYNCGIAKYTSEVVAGFSEGFTILADLHANLLSEDKANVIRCWSKGDLDPLETLLSQIKSRGINTVLIQFNWGFFGIHEISSLLHKLSELGIVVVFEMHSTVKPQGILDSDFLPFLDALRSCKRILVHGIDDLNRLKDFGLISNAALLPHGVMMNNPPKELEISASGNGPIELATFGFALPNKGFLELIRATRRVLDQGTPVHLRMYCSEHFEAISRITIAELKSEIMLLGLQTNVTFTSEFLDEETILRRLADAALVIIPYQYSEESASGSVRMALASGSPVAVTPSPIFNDVRDTVLTLSGYSAEEISAGLIGILNGTTKVTSGLKERSEWMRARQYKIIAKRLFGLLKALHMDQKQLQ